MRIRRVGRGARKAVAHPARDSREEDDEREAAGSAPRRAGATGPSSQGCYEPSRARERTLSPCTVAVCFT